MNQSNSTKALSQGRCHQIPARHAARFAWTDKPHVDHGVPRFRDHQRGSQGTMSLHDLWRSRRLYEEPCCQPAQDGVDERAQVCRRWSCIGYVQEGHPRLHRHGHRRRSFHLHPEQGLVRLLLASFASSSIFFKLTLRNPGSSFGLVPTRRRRLGQRSPT